MFCRFLPYSKVTQVYIYIHGVFFSHDPPSYSITSDQIQFPVCYTAESLFIHFRCHSLHLLTPNFQSLPLPSPPSWQPQACTPRPCVCCFFFVWKGSFVPHITFLDDKHQHPHEPFLSKVKNLYTGNESI